MSVYFVYGFKFVKIFFIKINSNKFTIKFFFYFLSFISSLSLSQWPNSSTSMGSLWSRKKRPKHSIELEFPYFLRQMYFFINANIVCSLVLNTSCRVNPIFLLNLHDSVVSQSIITVTASWSCKKFLQDWKPLQFINSCLCFLYFKEHFLVVARKHECLNFSSICF